MDDTQPTVRWPGGLPVVVWLGQNVSGKVTTRSTVVVFTGARGFVVVYTRSLFVDTCRKEAWCCDINYSSITDTKRRRCFVTLTTPLCVFFLS